MSHDDRSNDDADTGAQLDQALLALWSAANAWMTGGPVAFASPADMTIPSCVDSVDEAAALIEESMARVRPANPATPS